MNSFLSNLHPVRCCQLPAAKALQTGRAVALALLLANGLPGIAQAQFDMGNITPQQIEQFRSLPRAQQQMLADQMGVNLDSILAAANGQASSNLNVGQAGAALTQRGAMDTTEMEAQAAQTEREREAGQQETEVEELQREELELPRFGISLFDAEVSTFAPVDNAPVPPNYVLGPGDSLSILYLGAESADFTVTVDREGAINFPRLGPIQVAGLSFDDARAQIEQRVSEQLIGVRVVVSAGRLRAINLFMAGEVNTPGAYSVSALTTVTQALFVAGGVSEIGSLRNIQVRRNGETAATFDLYNLLLQGDSSNDIRLQSGDVLFVPPLSAEVAISGAVRRPARYEAIPGETVADLVNMAGRFESNAYIRQVTFERRHPGAALPELVNLDLTNSEALALALQNGDQLRVPVTSDIYSNGLEVKGAVVRPGAFAWQQGLRVSDLLPSVESHLAPDVDLSYALIVSIKNERLDIRVTNFNLGEAIRNPGSEADPLLQSRDELLVFNLPEAEEAQAQVADDELAEEEILIGRQQLLQPVLAKLRRQAREQEPVQVVSVSGAVKVPGEYPLSPGDQLNDLLFAAGGLRENAFLTEAELRRVNVSTEGLAGISLMAVNLGLLGSDTVSNPEIQSRDHLLVRSIPDWTPQRSVQITGEVRFPGSYLIGLNETLSDLIQRAGGIKPEGFAMGAFFTRESARESQREQIGEYIDRLRRSFAARSLTRESQNTDFATLAPVIEAMDNFEPVGRFVVDIPSVMLGDESADITLQDGDALHIPLNPGAVSVVGEVRRTGVFRHQADLRVEDYLELGAGITDRGDEEAIYVVRANGAITTLDRSWIRFDAANTNLLPGDTIVVPVNAEYRDTMTFWQQATAIAYQTGITIAAIANLF